MEALAELLLVCRVLCRRSSRARAATLGVRHCWNRSLRRRGWGEGGWSEEGFLSPLSASA